MPLTATLTYDAATRLLTVTDAAAPAGAFYELLRVLPGLPAQLLPTGYADAGGVKFTVPADGVYRLQLARLNATGVGAVGSYASVSAELVHLETHAHHEAVARSYDLLCANSPKGHPLNDCLRVLARVSEARACLAENAPTEADRLLLTTNLPT